MRIIALLAVMLMLLRDGARRAGNALWRDAKRLATEDDGYSTETVLITALLVAAAIIAVGIITAKIIGKANSINLG